MIWRRDYDEFSNSYWYADSKFQSPEGYFFQWRLKQKLENDEIVWYEAHDSDIQIEPVMHFQTLEEAKSVVEAEANKL